MPEGHTIHRLAKDHQENYRGQPLQVSSPQGRFESEAERLNGQRLDRVEAHGKHLFYHWEAGELVHIHLGLYGKFRNYRTPVQPPRGQVRLRLVGQDRYVDLHGPNRCEILSGEQYAAIRQRLGDDPLRRDACPERVAERVLTSRAAIGSLLLNQSIIAGIGNVYRAELLYLTQIHPSRAGNQLSGDQFQQLWDLTVKLLRVGVRHNRIITVDRESAGKPLSRLTSAERLWIYKKSHCPACGTPVSKWDLGSRAIYACDSCQQ